MLCFTLIILSFLFFCEKKFTNRRNQFAKYLVTIIAKSYIEDPKEIMHCIKKIFKTIVFHNIKTVYHP